VEDFLQEGVENSKNKMKKGKGWDGKGTKEFRMRTRRLHSPSTRKMCSIMEEAESDHDPRKIMRRT
jgi:hypothetical protein